jgi:hypothetical protein
MKTYSIYLPVMIGAENERASMYEHSLTFTVSARNKKAALKKLENQLASLPTTIKKETARA